MLATPPLIKVAKMKHLVDEPSNERKLHRKSIPTLGGILIFAATIISYCLWFPSRDAWELGANYNPLQALNEFKYILASMFALFFIGLKDDIVGVDPLKKLIIHLLVGFTLVVLADIRLTEFWGLFEVDKLPYWLSVVLSIFIYIVIVNAINLIDGVDGLAGGIGLIGSVTLFGFLIFNFQPARIFMGDSGSLIIGICMYVLAMKLIEFPPSKLSAAMQIVSKPIFAMAILAYPLIDTLRVFTIRILNGKSPFLADKNHIHHRLLAIGLKHYQVSIALYCYTLFIIGTTFLMPPQTPNISFLAVGSIAVLLAYVPFMIPKKKVS
jgi:UDP-N-acetylmuramyl pentapeptide phosphotransferase/UDP-N-acetylglucosamine-1-phosphate transferase